MKRHIPYTLALAAIIMLSTLRALGQSPYWEATNGPYWGSVSSMAVAPDGTLYTTGNGESAFRSTDQGSTWTELRLRLAFGACLLAVGDDGFVWLVSQHQIYRSTDRGDDWTNVGHLTGGGEVGMVVRRGHVYISVSDNTIMMSEDNGQTWISRATPATGVERSTLSRMGVDRLGRLWVGGMFYDYLYKDYSGWTAMSYEGSGDWVDYTIYDFDPSVTVFIASDYLYLGGRTYSITDSGQSLPSLRFPIGVSLIGSTRENYVIGLSNTALMRGRDYGAIWDTLSTALTLKTVRTMVFDSSGILYAVTQEGTMKSTDSGFHWTSFAVPTKENIQCLAVDKEGRYFAGTPSSGVLFSDAPGQMWHAADSGVIHNGISSLLVGPDGRVVAGTTNGLYISSDRGRSWNRSARWDSLPYASGSITAIVSNSAGHIFAAVNPGWIFRSIDSGVSWKPIVGGLIYDHPTAMVATTDGDLFVGVVKGGIYKSTDDGENWLRANNGYGESENGNPESEIAAIVESRAGRIFAGSRYGLFYSDDRGGSWARTPQIGYNNIIALASNNSGDIFTSSGEGVFRSTDDGDFWEPISSGLPYNFSVATLAIDRDDHLLAGTSCDGVYRSVDRTSSVETAPVVDNVSLILDQPRTNATTGDITFTYSIPRTMNVRLRLFDMRGILVAVIANELMTPGRQESTLSVQALASGSYLCRLDGEGMSRSVVLQVVR